MVLDLTDPDSRSVGSIFLSPVITLDQAAALQAVGASPHAYADGPLRVGASWLIRQAGYELGQNLARGVRISNRHFTLVTEKGATAANFAVSANAIRDRVHRSTGVDLDFEPDLIGDEAVFDALVDPVHR